MPITNAEIGDESNYPSGDLINVYRCRIGNRTTIGAFVEIQKNSTVGSRCRVGANAFICEGVTVGDDVAIGPGVMFTNDPYPKAVTEAGELMGDADWAVVSTHVGNGATIGANSTILCGITIGAGAVIGPGSVVTRSIPGHAVASGVPARIIGLAPTAPPAATPSSLTNDTRSAMETTR